MYGIAGLLKCFFFNLQGLSETQIEKHKLIRRSLLQKCRFVFVFGGGPGACKETWDLKKNKL